MEKKWNHGYKCLGLHVYIVCLSDPSLSKYCPLFSHNYRRFVLTTISSFLSYLSFPYLISIGLSIMGLWLWMNAREEHSTSNISSHTEVTHDLGCISMNWRNAAEVSGLTWVWIQSLVTLVQVRWRPAHRPGPTIDMQKAAVGDLCCWPAISEAAWCTWFSLAWPCRMSVQQGRGVLGTVPCVATWPGHLAEVDTVTQSCKRLNKMQLKYTSSSSHHYASDNHTGSWHPVGVISESGRSALKYCQVPSIIIMILFVSFMFLGWLLSLFVPFQSLASVGTGTEADPVGCLEVSAVPG